jgi:NTP pyrophosphatase (non-canonical NTP hydrolase)
MDIEEAIEQQWKKPSVLPAENSTASLPFPDDHKIEVKGRGGDEPYVPYHLSFDYYQESATDTDMKTLIGDDPLVYLVLGLSGEAGEIANKLKKVHRDKNGQMTNEDREALKDEAGDVLWYLTRICSALGYDLIDVARGNLIKLAKRQAKRGG